MTGRDAAIRRVLIRLRDHFSRQGWLPEKSPATMLIMAMLPAPAVEHRLIIREPISSHLLPNDQLLGLSCSVNVAFKKVETLVCEVFSRNPDTYASESASIALCQVAPPGSCHLGVHLVTPESETSLKRLVDGYHANLEPIARELKDASVFDREDYVPPAISVWSWNMRRAAYFYLQKPKEHTLRYLDVLERDVDEALAVVRHQPEGQLVFGTVEAAVAAGEHQSILEAKRLASMLRIWLLKNRS